MKKSNRQRVYEYLQAVKHPPKTGIFVVINVNEQGEIEGDEGVFSASGESGDVLTSEVERRIPATFLTGWLSGKGIRKRKSP